MSVSDRDGYLSLRQRHTPEKITLIIIAESPPASGKYFYNPLGRVTEPLFAAFMKVLCLSPSTKEEGLREFSRKGWVLVDATYEPVNRMTVVGRNNVIANDYPLLLDDLKTLMSGQGIPLVLIKANVCRL